MRLTIESTPEVGTFTIDGVTVPSRIWVGTTELGNRVLFFVTRIAASLDAAKEIGDQLQDVTSLTNEIVEPAEPPGTPDWEAMVETGVDLDELVTNERHVVRGYRWYRLVIDGHLVWIEPRPAYFDRGRFSAQYEGSFYITADDGFPRYYMDLETAKREMRAWLLHRIECDRRRRA
jgi:hypothetical protein